VYADERVCVNFAHRDRSSYEKERTAHFDAPELGDGGDIDKCMYGRVKSLLQLQEEISPACNRAGWTVSLTHDQKCSVNGACGDVT
jgi:hypothetical protein